MPAYQDTDWRGMDSWLSAPLAAQERDNILTSSISLQSHVHSSPLGG